MSQEVLAVVAGEEITQAEFDTFIKGLPREQQAYASHPQFKEQCLEQLIAVHMFAKEAEETKLDETDDFKTMIANARKDILAHLAMQEALKGAEVTAEEMQAYYDNNQKQFVKGGTISAKHILTETEEECTAILESITSGAKTFEDAAKESSKCPSGQNGGDLGEFGKGQMVKEFEDAAFAAEIGQVVGPVKTQFGYHLIQVEKKNEETVVPFEEAKKNIAQMLLQQKQNAAYGAKVAELKEKYLEK